MNVKLRNIGLVADCEIALNGLTVITGKNNSGKSTVGKALYSVLDAVCDIEQKAENDKNQFIRSTKENPFLQVGVEFCTIGIENH